MNRKLLIPLLFVTASISFGASADEPERSVAGVSYQLTTAMEVAEAVTGETTSSTSRSGGFFSRWFKPDVSKLPDFQWIAGFTQSDESSYKAPHLISRAERLGQKKPGLMKGLQLGARFRF